MRFVYMETKPRNGVMRFRGECGDDHDTDSHARKMNNKGYFVECHDSKVGEEVKHNVTVKVRVATDPDRFENREKTVTHTEYQRGLL